MKVATWVWFVVIFIVGKFFTLLVVRRLLLNPATRARQFAWQTTLLFNVTIFLAITVPLGFTVESIVVASIIALIGLGTGYLTAYYWFQRLRKRAHSKML